MAAKAVVQIFINIRLDFRLREKTIWNYAVWESVARLAQPSLEFRARLGEYTWSDRKPICSGQWPCQASA